MSGSEFVFLALGLLLGVAAGAALVEILRARPPAPREVRLTVSQDAIPRRRAATLADDAFTGPPPEPARGGPADRRIVDDLPPPGTVDRRTPVRVGAGAAATTTGAPPADLVGVPVTGGDDPMIAALRTSAAVTAVAAMRRGGARTAEATMDRPVPTPTAAVAASAAAAARADGPTDPAEPAGPTAAAGAATPSEAAMPTGPCGELRQRADERCELATRAKEGATAADDALRAARRAYDDHETRAEAAARIADPRSVRDAKDAAQAAFRAGRNGATTTDEVEATARAWLEEINRINAEARDATAEAVREREAVRELTLQLERLALEADAARIAAETAAAACVAARQAVADCEEGQAAEPIAAAAPMLGAQIGLPADDQSPGVLRGGGGTPRIFRLLRGERAAMSELVTAMAGDDPDARRRWQIALSDLVDAILADSIAATALEFPGEHPFWGPFTLEQDREIAGALASLGYRFDGMGGWVDGRVPSQRDLSLAVGYAGLDPMRIRQWPTESEMADLYAEVAVAADEHLAQRAGDLTLGELISMLGRRADGLAEVWNEWGRLRPLLLAEA